MKYSMSVFIHDEDLSVNHAFPELLGKTYCTLKQALEGDER